MLEFENHKKVELKY